MKKGFLTIGLIALTLVLSSWGDVGHRMISANMQRSFQQNYPFLAWSDYLEDHASDADLRKKEDPTEFPKHFIDIDSYPEFVQSGRINTDLNANMDKFGKEFMDKNGYLPWATIASYDSLVACMKRNDLAGARFHAADLGHYVADGHMPLHLTKNYDGQLTGQKGIHARYEIEMIRRYASEIDLKPMRAAAVKDVESYIFEYIYENHPYVDSLLNAEKRAAAAGGGIETDTYYKILWEQTEGLTERMFQNASHAFAELMLSAWIEAGKPSLKRKMNIPC